MGDASVANLFSTVVHEAVPYSTNITNLFSTVVHEAVPYSTNITNLFSTIAHGGPTFSVPDITGTVGITASYDASPQGFPTSSTSYQWSWSSVPSGSSITNAILPLPDSGTTYPVSGNVGLWHFDSQNTGPTPAQGSIGLRDSYGDGWHGDNFVNVSVNGTPVLVNITLAAGHGPEWFNYAAAPGDAVVVTYTAGSWPNECSYTLNSGSNGSGVDFYTSPASPTGPATPYAFTAGTFLTGSETTTPDSSGQGNNATPDGVTLVSSSYVGSHCYEFDGVDDSIDLGIVPSDIGIGGGNSRTIAFWASSSVWVNNSVFFSMGDDSNSEDFTFIQRTPSDVKLNFWNDDLQVTVNNSPGWHHYFLIYDSGDGNSYIYQDNLLLGSNPVNPNTIDAYRIIIGDGASPSWQGNYYEGKIDEFAIWDRALTSCERSTIYNFLQTGSIDAASGSSPNLLEQFSFVPDVTGTYSIDLEMMDTNNCTLLTGTVEALISLSPGPSSGDINLYLNFTEVAWIYDASVDAPPISSSSTTFVILPQKSGGPMIDSNYVINSYKALSSERIRRVEQVPFRLARKDRLGVRRIIEPPPPPESEKIRIYENFAEVAWIASSSATPYPAPPPMSPPAPLPSPPPAPSPEEEGPSSIEFRNVEVVLEAERATENGSIEFRNVEVVLEAERADA